MKQNLLEQLIEVVDNMDTQTTKGLVRLYTHKDGKILQDTGWIENLGMTVRLPVVSGLYVNSGAQTAFGWLAVGTSNTAVSAGQTTLVAELSTLGLARVAATVSRQTTNSSNDTSQLTTTWTASGSTTVEEMGYFNASSSGVMGGRALTTSMTLTNGVQLTGTYKIIHT